MQLSMEHRQILLQGLKDSIRMKEKEIKKLQKHPDEKEGFCCEVEDVEAEIKEIKKLYESVNSLKNQILFVPDNIQLHLHVEEK